MGVVSLITLRAFKRNNTKDYGYLTLDLVDQMSELAVNQTRYPTLQVLSFTRLSQLIRVYFIIVIFGVKEKSSCIADTFHVHILYIQ